MGTPLEVLVSTVVPAEESIVVPGESRGEAVKGTSSHKTLISDTSLTNKLYWFLYHQQ